MINITQLHGPVRVWLALMVIWSIIWKGFALWRAAHKEEKGWFIALLIVNTIGILDILYLYVFSKHHGRKDTTAQQ
ncbi:MAG TPA: DUF5652 family protein [Candidatus Paceibacterota bacterium]|nr:DUF5652 family protein [Candidatus Paceibacterota bacterium]